MNPVEPIPYSYIKENTALEPFVQCLHAAGRVALDTEADSLHNYFEKVCLIQLSFRGEHYLIDPLCGLELAEFLTALADKPLILHGADYDLRMLRASLGFRPQRDVFDTMIAAQLLGFEQIGLAALIERYFEMTIGKAGQKSDWSRRPLSEKQLVYAVNDTRFLEELAERMAAELAARGRLEWHRESCRAMVASAGRDTMRDRENAWRVKGAGRLSRRQLAYLREIWRWRDQQAQAANLPSFRILGTPEILTLVQWAESQPTALLQGGPKLPRNLTAAQVGSLEQAIVRAASMDEAQWPEARKREDEPPRNDCAEEINALRAECARIAQELEIAPATLAPRAALEAVVRSRARSVDEIMNAGHLLGWQAALVHDAVEHCPRLVS